MIHAFEKEIAAERGLLEAIILNHIAYWVEKNEANGTNEHDGKFWTYHSAKGFEGVFPYATAKQIRTALDHLKESGFIETGCFNKDGRDRTLWYTLTEKGKCILLAGQMHFACGENALALQGKPLPSKENTNKETTSKEYKRFTPPTLEEVKAYCKERNNNVDADRWMNYYTANGWKVGKNPMKDWKAAVRTWERGTAKHFNSERSYDDDFFAKLERRDNGTAGDN